MTKKAFDPSKFRKTLTKSITEMSAGFHDPTTWIDTGNYVLNHLISGDFYKGVPLGKVTMFAGEPGCLPGSAKVRIRSKLHPDIITSITVEKLRDLFHSKDKHNFEIATPDGYVPIVSWVDKGEMTMLKLTTPTYTTTCATTHLLEVGDNKWSPAINIKVGDLVKTESGMLPVIKINKAKPEQCYDFEVDHYNHRYWGDGFSSHNSGKSYICSANIVRDAQKQGVFVVLIDTENALDESWLTKLGVDTSDDMLLKLNMSMIDDVAKTVATFMSEYREMEPQDRPKVLFVIDSVGMLMSPTEVSQFQSGDLKGDMGRNAKALKGFIKNCVNMFGEHDIGLVITNHTYEDQSLFATDQKISGGSGIVFASSIVVQIQKHKLKEDEDGAKVKEDMGIKASCKVAKTRYAKPFDSVKINIPYETGMDRYSGMVEFFEKKNLLIKTGHKLTYIDLEGNEHKYYRKDWKPERLELIMKEFDEKKRVYTIPSYNNTDNEQEENL